MSEIRSYPRHVNTDAGEIEFRLMSRADEAAVLAFAQRLPTHDLLFLPRNISEPKVLAAWIHEIERGDIESQPALKGGIASRPRHPGARPPFLVAACRRDPDGGVTGCARAGGRAGAVAGDLCAGAWCRAREAVGADDRRPTGARSRCSKASASRPRRCCETTSGTLTARSMTSWCLGTMWRRSRHRWRPMACLGRYNVGKDLEYIRFNGSLIGGLPGLALYTLEYLLRLV